MKFILLKLVKGSCGYKNQINDILQENRLNSKASTSSCANKKIFIITLVIT